MTMCAINSTAVHKDGSSGAIWGPCQCNSVKLRFFFDEVNQGCVSIHLMSIPMGVEKFYFTQILKWVKFIKENQAYARLYESDEKSVYAYFF